MNTLVVKIEDYHYCPTHKGTRKGETLYGHLDNSKFVFIDKGIENCPTHSRCFISTLDSLNRLSECDKKKNTISGVRVRLPGSTGAYDIPNTNMEGRDVWVYLEGVITDGLSRINARSI